MTHRTEEWDKLNCNYSALWIQRREFLCIAYNFKTIMRNISENFRHLKYLFEGYLKVSK